jgi:hypothetical protein
MGDALKYIRLILVFYWDEASGVIDELSYHTFRGEIILGQDIPIDLLQRWELP